MTKEQYEVVEAFVKSHITWPETEPIGGREYRYSFEYNEGVKAALMGIPRSSNPYVGEVPGNVCELRWRKGHFEARVRLYGGK